LQRGVCKQTAGEGEKGCIDFWHELTL
jgi:hypothetical protein